MHLQAQVAPPRSNSNRRASRERRANAKRAMTFSRNAVCVQRRRPAKNAVLRGRFCRAERARRRLARALPCLFHLRAGANDRVVAGSREKRFAPKAFQRL
jgi:hypothetical protein